jgi:hypothetical protein
MSKIIWFFLSGRNKSEFFKSAFASFLEDVISSQRAEVNELPKHQIPLGDLNAEAAHLFR